MKLLKVISTILLWLVFLLSFTKDAYAFPEIHINIPEYKLILLDNNQIIKTYEIAVGSPRIIDQTPVGVFRVTEKEKYPVWYLTENEQKQLKMTGPIPPGPNNPLGTRWMEFFPAYGIHGTIYDWSIDSAASGGCIRMHNQDAEDLYDRVFVGTPVIINYETMIICKHSDGLYVKILPDVYNKKINTIEHYLEVIKPYLSKYPLIVTKILIIESNDEYEIKIANNLQN